MNKLLLSCLLMMLIFLDAKSQQTIMDWPTMDSFIQRKKNLVDVLDNLRVIQEKAMQQKNDLLLLRCYYYRMAVNDVRREDSTYFINSQFIDSFLNKGLLPQQTAVLHLLKAKRLAGFMNRSYFWSNKNLMRNPNGPPYATMEITTLDSLIQQAFQLAKTTKQPTQNTPPIAWLWLADDPWLFFFKPVFTDMVYAAEINWLQTKLPNTYNHVPQKNWLLLDPDSFMDTTVAIPELSNKNSVLKAYRQWAAFQTKNDANAYYFIETLARKYFYNADNKDSTAEKRYEQYLRTAIKSPHNAVRAHAVYQLCLLWNQWASKYITQPEWDYSRNSSSIQRFDSTYRLYYIKSLSLFHQHETLLDSFTYIKKILLSMERKMMEPKVTMQLSHHPWPNKPLPVYISFRNAANIHVKIVRLPPFIELTNNNMSQDIAHFLKLSEFDTSFYTLPPQDDYQQHATFLKLRGLPIGRYAILYSNNPLVSANTDIAYLDIAVSSIATVSNNGHVFVMDRQTGLPIKDADITARERIKNTSNQHAVNAYTYKDYQTMKTDGHGQVHLTKKDIFNAKAIYKTDSVLINVETNDDDKPDWMYDHDDYDSKLEYYEDHIKLHLFTDRSIYRPGQKVFFKGIFLMRNPTTGEQIVLNWKNLQLPFFKKLYYRWMLPKSKKQIDLVVQDAFNRNVDTFKISPNKFGSVTGFFVIPTNAATGSWRFDLDNLEIDSYNTGEFKVEEYKRPTFEVNIEKPKKELQLGDSFSVAVKLRAFSGSQMNNVFIKYNIERHGYLPTLDSATKAISRKYITNQIKKDIKAYTNEQGELQIPITDTGLLVSALDHGKIWSASYRLEVEAIDATGESHEIKTDINLSNRPINIEVPIAAIVDRSDIKPIYITTKNEFAGLVKKAVSIQLYKVSNGVIEKKSMDWPPVDCYIYEPQSWATWFPETLPTMAAKPDTALVYETQITSGGDEKLQLPANILQSGNYFIKATSKENGNITGQVSRPFQIFDQQAKTLPTANTAFDYLPFNSVAKGQAIKWITGTTYDTVHAIYERSYRSRKTHGLKVENTYYYKEEYKGLNTWITTIPEDAVGDVKLSHLYIIDNQLYKTEKTIYQPASASNKLEIYVEQYRSRMAPGGQETFTVSIKTKNENTAAELMTTLYDASLDKIEKHEWRIPRNDNPPIIRNNWENGINGLLTSNLYSFAKEEYSTYTGVKPLWWINPLDYAYNKVDGSNQLLLHADWDNGLNVMGDFSNMLQKNGDSYALAGRLAGVDITNAQGLNDVVVIGYGSSIRRDYSGSVASVVQIRGVGTFTGNEKALFILDGIPYTGDISSLDVSLLTQIVILKDATASALYGSRAANGVIMMSTKGPVIVPEAPPTPPLVIRKNFSETAFFFPQVHASSDGFFHISFTMPESVTEWKWMMLAHTKKAAFSYLEKNIFTQLPLMVQPNMPRFLFQDDKLTLQTRISNLDTIATTGQATCTIEDAETGEDLTSIILQNNRQPFTMDAKATTSVAFNLNIPAKLLHPLRIKTIARSGNFADGEEHVIPILSKKIWIDLNIPFTIATGSSSLRLPTPPMPTDAEALGFGLHIDPKRQATVLYALPYMANYLYGCAEQTFNKLLAHSMATQLMRTDTSAQAVFKNVPSTPISKTKDGLPNELAEETMPWLRLNHAEALQQQDLYHLLDTLVGNKKIETYLNTLVSMQNDDGGITWFNGGTSDRYISNYILAGFGKMMQYRMPLLVSYSMPSLFLNFRQKLVAFCDQQFLQTRYGAPLFDRQDFSYLYARAFWLKEQPLAQALSTRIDTTLANCWKKVDDLDLADQAMLIIASLKYRKDFETLARQQLRSIAQLAENDPVKGMRWKEVSNSDDLNTNDEETIALIAEAFEAAGQQQDVANILQWLLQNKQEHHWGTTKSTAAVASLLHRQQPVTVGMPIKILAGIGDQIITVTDNMLAGESTDFLNETVMPDTIGIVTKKTNAPVSGGLHYYYFSANPPILNSASITLKKTMQRWDAATNTWQVLQEGNMLKIGDHLKTTLHINAAKQLQYVFIDDKRAACLEPADASSGYEWSKDFVYYKSVRDVGFQFFANKIPSGITSLQYETIVSKEGIFSNGITSLQCMYRPEIKAYCDGGVITATK